MTSSKIRPRLVYADKQGNIYDHPELLMLSQSKGEVLRPRPEELTSLPEGSDIFFLPQRYALGYDSATGSVERLDSFAVAAFVCPGYTLTGLSAFESEDNAKPLPLYAYGALGFDKDRFWVAAKQVDTDPRQQFEAYSPSHIEHGIKILLKKYPHNRLLAHLSRCALTYCCPAAKNLALGRYEAPLPTARTCNANCLGCISHQEKDTGFPANQHRISFRPTPKEITQIMFEHASHEKKPIFSFGQGCEGEPLLEASLLQKALSEYRSQDGPGTININSNGSLPEVLEGLKHSGLNSIRVSLNSAQKSLYTAYYRPKSYTFQDVKETISRAKALGLFVSLNYLFFPGITDQEQEYAALADLISASHLDFIQLRNLNIDPELYLQVMPSSQSPFMGLSNFQKRLHKEFPWLGFGYFNPYLGSPLTTP
jgi:wyosine [tRNA(Phe)-imidazoG37] synthetase (radical SAM superfamily)